MEADPGLVGQAGDPLWPQHRRGARACIAAAGAATTGTPSVTIRLGNERSATARALLPTGTVKHRSGRLQAPKGAAAAMGEQLGQAIDLMRPLARISTNLRPDRW